MLRGYCELPTFHGLITCHSSSALELLFNDRFIETLYIKAVAYFTLAIVVGHNFSILTFDIDIVLGHLFDFLAVFAQALDACLVAETARVG
jgi:hypothetical protein